MEKKIGDRVIDIVSKRECIQESPLSNEFLKLLRSSDFFIDQILEVTAQNYNAP